MSLLARGMILSHRPGGGDGGHDELRRGDLVAGDRMLRAISCQGAPMRSVTLGELRVGGYSLEMANPRHEHEWRVWEKVKLPKGRVLIPGLISHATNIVEHPELVAERIVRLAKLVGRDNVIASTDCGFAQGPFARRVHPSIQWAKLRALAEGARLASRALWPRPARRKAAGKPRARRRRRTKAA